MEPQGGQVTGTPLVAGLIGGFSWRSTGEYYRVMNAEIGRMEGRLHSAGTLLRSLDSALILEHQRAHDWAAAAKDLEAAGKGLQEAGASFLMIVNVALHKVADEVRRGLTVPLLHIADPLARRIVDDGVGTVGLLGASSTLTERFYIGRLEERTGVRLIWPEREQRQYLDDLIFGELAYGIFDERSRRNLVNLSNQLLDAGADAVALACTELELLLSEEQLRALPLYPSGRLHAEAAADWLVNGSLDEDGRGRAATDRS